MKRLLEQKAADSVVNAVGRIDFKNYAFVHELLEQPYEIKERIDKVFLIYLQMRKAGDQVPKIPIETDLKKVDLTEFDQ
jgi:hypothetical protein